jgi:hypothetical protein
MQQYLIGIFWIFGCKVTKNNAHTQENSYFLVFFLLPSSFITTYNNNRHRYNPMAIDYHVYSLYAIAYSLTITQPSKAP